MARKLSKFGNSYALPINKGQMEAMGISPDTPLNVSIVGSQMEREAREARRALKRLRARLAGQEKREPDGLREALTQIRDGTSPEAIAKSKEEIDTWEDCYAYHANESYRLARLALLGSPPAGQGETVASFEVTGVGTVRDSEGKDHGWLLALPEIAASPGHYILVRAHQPGEDE